MPSGHFCRNSLDRCTVSRKGVWFVSTMWGIHVTKWLGTLSLLLFLAPHNVGFFRISLFIPNGICSNIAQSTQKIKFFLVVSAILRSGLILENIRRMFLLSIWAAGTMYMNLDEKHSPNALENQTRLQYSAYTTRKSLIFIVLCSLFEQIPSGINRDILNSPIWCGAKNSNKLCTPSHLVTWIPITVLYTLFYRIYCISCKQCRPWSDTAFCGVWSGSAVCQWPVYRTLDINGLRATSHQFRFWSSSCFAVANLIYYILLHCIFFCSFFFQNSNSSLYFDGLINNPMFCFRDCFYICMCIGGTNIA